MTRGQAAGIGAALVIAGLAVLGLWHARQPAEIQPPPAAARTGPMVAPEGDEVRLRLYFPGGGWLVAEERLIAAGDGGADLGAVAAEVVAGPESPGLRAPFPAGTRVGSVFISASGIAYVDLAAAEANPPRSGSRDEMLSVYSLVNSVQANLPELSGVVLLWNGQQRPTFAGHLDTGQPLTENRSLVSRP